MPFSSAAEGGVFTRPTLTMMADAGEPEVALPLSRLGRGGGTLVVKVMIGEREVGEAVIRDFNRRALGGDRGSIPAEMINTRNRS